MRAIDLSHGGGADFSCPRNTIFPYHVVLGAQPNETLREIAFCETTSVRKEAHIGKTIVRFFRARGGSLPRSASAGHRKGNSSKAGVQRLRKLPRRQRRSQGKSASDGKSFVDNDNKSWTVTNPEALKGHEGHEVTLKAHVDSAKNEIHVVSVKMAKKETKETTKKEEKK